MTLVSQSFKWLTNADGTLDGAFPNGDKTPTENLSWDNTVFSAGLISAGVGDIDQGNAFSHNVRQYLSGTEAALATLSVVSVSGTTSGWSISSNGAGDNLQYNGTNEGSGTLQVRAVGSTNTANSASFFWSCTAEPEPDEADFIIQTQNSGNSNVTFDGIARGVQPGHIIEFESGNHIGKRTLENIIGNANNYVIIRGPQTSGGPAIIRLSSASSGAFVLTIRNCHYFILDGETTSTGCPILEDGKRHGIKIMYNQNAVANTASTHESSTAFIKFNGNPPPENPTPQEIASHPFDLTDRCVIRYLEIDGGWTDTGTSVSKGTPIGIAANDKDFIREDYPTAYQQDVIIEHNFIHNTGAEGMYVGSNLQYGEVSLRRFKIRNNYIRDTGGAGITHKNVLDGNPGIDQFPNSFEQDSNNSIHDNIVLRAVGAASQNGIAGLSCQSCRTAVYNNIVGYTKTASTQPAGAVGKGIRNYVDRWTAHFYGNIPFTIPIFNNIILDCPNHGIHCTRDSQGSANAAPPTPTYQVFNNTVAGCKTGINMDNCTSSSWARNNIVVGCNTAINQGPATASNNITTGTPTSYFVDFTDVYPQANDIYPNVDLHLKANQAAVGSVGTDIAPFDKDGDTRNANSDKGAYDYP